MNPTQIIHKLEVECGILAYDIIIADKVMDVIDRTQTHIYENSIKVDLEQYDFNQSIITILEKIDEGKIEKKLNVIDNEVKKIKYGLTNKGRAIAITNWLGGGE